MVIPPEASIENNHLFFQWRYKKRGNLSISSLGGGDEPSIENLVALLKVLQQIK
jgi:hypothetical protein